MLGYTQAAWDARALPDTFTLQWKELVYEEQQAATILGFDKGTWDGCAGSEIEDKKEEVTFVKDPLRRIRMNMVISRSYTEVSSYREQDPSEQDGGEEMTERERKAKEAAQASA